MRLSDPVPLPCSESIAVQGYFVLCTNDESIVFSVFRDDEEGGSTAERDTPALTDSIKKYSLMSTEDTPGGINDISLFLRDFSFQEFAHGYFPDEADTLTVLSVSIWQSNPFCECSYFAFTHASYRK